MSTTLVHIGDFHAAPGPRNGDRYRALDQIIAEGLALPRLGAWLWPGDLNHGRMTIDDRNALADRIIRMASAAPILIVPGNHDLLGDLEIFARLQAGHPIYVIDRPACVRIRLAGGQWATVFFLPYPTKAGLTSAGIAHGDLIPTAADALDAIFMQAADELKTARGRGDVTFMIGHVNVAGSMTSVGQPNVGYEIEIGPRHLDRLGPIYKGLNHIHKAQHIADAWYAGSVCRLNWGEIEPKGYIVVEYGEDPDYLLHHKMLDVPAMYHVEGTLSRDGFVWQVTAGPGGEVQPPPASWKGAEVRCRYRFKQSEKSALSSARVLAEFAEALRLDVEPIAVPDRELRAPEVAAARTLAAKVAAYQKVEQLAPAVAEKLAILEHGDPLQVLTNVQNALAQIEAGENEKVAA